MILVVVQILVSPVDLEAGVRAWVGGLADLNVTVGGTVLDGDGVDILSLKHETKSKKINIIQYKFFNTIILINIFAKLNFE